MSVPSRSRNTAGSFASHEVMFETCDQFVTRHSGSSELADDYGAAMVGNFSGFKRRGVANKREGEKRNSGIACSGDVKNVSGFRRDVMRWLVSLEKHHSMFAKRDQNAFRVPFFERRLPSPGQIDVILWRFVRIAPGNSCGEERFGAVWLHDGHSAPIDYVARIRVRRDDFASSPRVACDLRDQIASQKTFPVVFEDERVNLGKRFTYCRDDLCDLLVRRTGNPLAINADNLLMPGNNSRLDDRLKIFVLDEMGNVDLLSGEEVAQLAPAAILSDLASY